jgi:hypothetical protein
MSTEKRKITSVHIENDIVNDRPTPVFTDEHGIEWVFEEQTSQYSGYITAFVEKSKSWYFKSENKTNKA